MVFNVPKSLFLTLFMVFFTSFAFAETCKQKEGTLLILGDSLSAAYGLKEEQGWVSLLGQHWQSKFPGMHVVNASVSGSTSAAGLKLLPDLLAKHKPQWVILELGGNDGLQGKPINYIRSNLIKMITLADEDFGKIFTVQTTTSFVKLKWLQIGDCLLSSHSVVRWSLKSLKLFHAILMRDSTWGMCTGSFRWVLVATASALTKHCISHEYLCHIHD